MGSFFKRAALSNRQLCQTGSFAKGANVSRVTFAFIEYCWNSSHTMPNVQLVEICHCRGIFDYIATGDTELKICNLGGRLECEGRVSVITREGNRMIKKVRPET